MRNINRIIYILSLCILLSLAAIPSSAAAKDTRDIIADNSERVIAVSHRGDTALYPANSIEAIEAAALCGADAVSVAVNKTADGELVLCEDVTLSNICETTASSLDEITLEDLKKCRLYDNLGNVTEIYPVTLSEALESINGEIYLILDVKYEDVADVCAVIAKQGAFSQVSLRCEAKSSKADELSGYGADIIGIYGGNIVWDSINHINRFSEAGMTMVEYRTKNYFNVCYGTVVGDSFSAEGKARAVAAAYDPDLCGKRTDDANGWNELIKNGFTVIETNNIAALASYVRSSVAQREALLKLTEGVKNTDFSAYSDISRKNIDDALTYANEVLEGRAKSLAEYEAAYSSLNYSLGSKMIAEGKQETKGALNITAGKIAVAVLVGAAFLAAQIFIENLKKNKDKETEENYNGNKTEVMDNESKKA